jgi:hypothetical protein
MNFVAPLQHSSPEEYRTITLFLSVDPGPGCGGIAWPAGEVGPLVYSPHGCRLLPLSTFVFKTFFHRYHHTPSPNVRHVQVLANYLARRGSTLEGLNVLELGSGTGLVGLLTGYLGARVCITDQAYVSLPTPTPLSPWQGQDIMHNGLSSSSYIFDPVHTDRSSRSWSAISLLTNYNPMSRLQSSTGASCAPKAAARGTLGTAIFFRLTISLLTIGRSPFPIFHDRI